MPWYFYAISGVLISALSHVIRRRVMTGSQKLDFYTSSYLFSLTMALALFVYVLFAGFEMPPIIDLWPIMFINISMGIIAWLTNNKGLSLINLGEYSILMTTRQVFTWIASVVFLGIGLNQTQGFGTILILLGIIIVYTNKKAFKNNNLQGVVFTLITAFIYGFAILTDQIIYRQSDPASYMLIGFTVTAIVIGLFRPKLYKKTKLILSPKYAANLLGFGALSALGLVLIFTSLKIADNAPLVTAIFQLQTIAAVILGIFILKEKKNIVQKMIGATVSSAGAVLVVVG